MLSQSQSFFKPALAALCLTSLSFCSIASDMSLLKSESSVNFISVKIEHIAESHTFDNFSGTLDSSGNLNIAIDLASVNTMIPIRNERMKAMLFKVSDFAQATFTAQIDSQYIELAVGEQKQASVSGDLTISGQTVKTSFDLVITGLASGKLSAATAKPTLIQASDFGLESGIAALQEVAMLKSISKTVPLSFSVVFEKN